MTTIRDALIRPDSSLAHLDKLRKLLKWHSGRLRRPWEPFEAPSPASRAALNTSSLTIPHTSAQLGIDERSRTTALELSDRLGIDELECLLLVKSYDRHALRDFEDEQDGDVNRVALWYAEEAEAVPQIVLALYRLSRDRDEGWAGMVAEMRQVAVGDETKYVEGLFRAFGRMAQKQLEGMRRSENAILW